MRKDKSSMQDNTEWKITEYLSQLACNSEGLQFGIFHYQSRKITTTGGLGDKKTKTIFKKCHNSRTVPRGIANESSSFGVTEILTEMIVAFLAPIHKNCLNLRILDNIYRACHGNISILGTIYFSL